MITDVILRKRGNRVHSWLSITTAGLLAFHAAVGCCAHHIHDCQAGARNTRIAQADLASHCHHDHGDHPGCPTNSDDQDAPDQHGWDGVRGGCVSSGGSQQVQPLMANAWICAPLFQLDQLLHPARMIRDNVALFSPAATLSVRLHLLHELFLI